VREYPTPALSAATSPKRYWFGFWYVIAVARGARLLIRKDSPEMAEVLLIGLVCPKCGKQLVGARGTNKAPLTDTLSCHEHGEVGRFEELIQQSSENVHHRVEDAISDFLRGSTENK
jgi:hypothetical protein